MSFTGNEELHALQSEYKSFQQEVNAERIEALKHILKEKAVALSTYTKMKEVAERDLKDINKKIMDVEGQIRKEWEPFVSGSDDSTLDVGGVVLQMKATLNVKTVDKFMAVEWLENNGFDDVLKKDIHASTLRSLATEKYEKEGVSIDGLEYSKFNLIKIKK